VEQAVRAHDRGRADRGDAALLDMALRFDGAR
jgi:hypothetical protein